jgi:hypothetical protein
VSATLDYEGVWRRGGRPYGWFVLAGAISEPAVARRRLRFRFELLAHPSWLPLEHDGERA